MRKKETMFWFLRGLVRRGNYPPPMPDKYMKDIWSCLAKKFHSVTPYGLDMAGRMTNLSGETSQLPKNIVTSIQGVHTAQ